MKVRTLFISGLPLDTKPRELYLLFRAYKGYENSLLKITVKNGKISSPIGFVTFTDRHSAEMAKEDLQGLKFDPDLPQVMRLEFAKSNTKVAKPKQCLTPNVLPTFLQPIVNGNGFFRSYTELLPSLLAPTFTAAMTGGAPSPADLLFTNNGQQQQQQLGGGGHHHLTSQALATTGVLDNGGAAGGVGNAAAAATLMHYSPLLQTFYHGCLPLSAAHHSILTASNNGAAAAALLQAAPYMQSPMATAILTANGHLLQPQQPQHQIQHQQQPGCTLFVANLAATTTEQELKELFSTYPGFVCLRTRNKNGSLVAFIEYMVWRQYFQDVRQASAALGNLQGCVLKSSDRGGIRIEFAKVRSKEAKIQIGAKELLINQWRKIV
uniref:RRM domain-containing protein n=1 Tax=Romanomermis culicivorax TaxID=13658 RepID=A0A915HS74_ROMCU